MKLYQALYNHMTYESDAQTLSLHRTKEGAERAIEKHKHLDWLDHLERYTPEKQKLDLPLKKNCGMTDDEIKEYDKKEVEDWPKSWQWWGIREIEVEE